MIPTGPIFLNLNYFRQNIWRLSSVQFHFWYIFRTSWTQLTAAEGFTIESVSIQAGCRKDVNEIKGRVEHQSKNSLSNMLGEEKITENICKFQIAFSQWRAWLIKRLFWDVFLRLASFVFMKNFRSISPAIHILSKTAKYLIIFA